MAEAADLVALLADEHGDDVLRAEALAGAGDGGEDHLRLAGRVEGGDAALAQIAMPTGLGRLAEIGEQGLASAARRLAQ